MTTGDDTTTGTHPLAVFAARLKTQLHAAAATPMLSMSAQDKKQTLVDLAEARASFEALQLRLLADAETTDACTETGAATAAHWLAVQTRQTKLATRADLTLALAVERHPVLSEAMAAAAVNTAQARVIVQALAALPSRGEYAVSLDQREHAEKHLVAEAAHHDAHDLRILGRRLFEVICPELADAYEAALLEAEEAAALRKTSFSMTRDGAGLCRFRGQVPERHGDMIRKAIQALTNPTRFETTTGSPIDPDLPTAVRDGIAFTHIIEAIEAHWLPTQGGVGATVVVTMTLDQVLGKLDSAGVCELDTGTKISAGEARRLACRAGIIPLVLGGPSVILDAGTKRRFHTETQRIALGLRDKHCTAEGCEVPAAMCHAHHDLPFSRGGPTSIANGRLLCGHHHRRVHDPAYRHRIRADNTIEFHRRT